MQYYYGNIVFSLEERYLPNKASTSCICSHSVFPNSRLLVRYTVKIGFIFHFKKSLVSFISIMSKIHKIVKHKLKHVCLTILWKLGVIR